MLKETICIFIALIAAALTRPQSATAQGYWDGNRYYYANGTAGPVFQFPFITDTNQNVPNTFPTNYNPSNYNPSNYNPYNPLGWGWGNNAWNQGNNAYNQGNNAYNQGGWYWGPNGWTWYNSYLPSFWNLAFSQPQAQAQG